MAKRTWQDDQGNDHPTKADAEKADAAYKAVAEFDEDREKVARLLLSKAMTGDGVPFENMTAHAYYRVTNTYGAAPRVEEVWLWPHMCEVDLQDGVRFVETKYHGHGRDSTRDCIPISDLYRSEKDARKVWARYYREWLARQVKTLTSAEEKWPEIKG